MPRKSASPKGAQLRYSSEYKNEALALAAQVRVSDAAAQLTLATSQLCNWPAKAESSRERSAGDHTIAAEKTRLKGLLPEKEQQVARQKRPARTLRSTKDRDCDPVSFWRL